MVDRQYWMRMPAIDPFVYIVILNVVFIYSVARRLKVIISIFSSLMSYLSVWVRAELSHTCSRSRTSSRKFYSYHIVNNIMHVLLNLANVSYVYGGVVRATTRFAWNIESPINRHQSLARQWAPIFGTRTRNITDRWILKVETLLTGAAVLPDFFLSLSLTCRTISNKILVATDAIHLHFFPASGGLSMEYTRITQIRQSCVWFPTKDRIHAHVFTDWTSEIYSFLSYPENQYISIYISRIRCSNGNSAISVLCRIMLFLTLHLSRGLHESV